MNSIKHVRITQADSDREESLETSFRAVTDKKLVFTIDMGSNRALVKESLTLRNYWARLKQTGK